MELVHCPNEFKVGPFTAPREKRGRNVFNVTVAAGASAGRRDPRGRFVLV